MRRHDLIRRAWLALWLCASMAGPAVAQERGDEALREASKHFQRGVALYAEADYGGALVEFKRAAEIAPNPTVLFNIGQTEYQLRDYASALRTFERYLAEAPPNATNRSEVENGVKVLRSRVGRLTVITEPAGADVAIDDAPAGKTPFAKPVLVGVGRVKVVASIPGRAPATRYVDVAADDDVSVALTLSSTPSAVPAAPPTMEGARVDLPPEAGASSTGSHWHGVGWVATGAAASGALAFGLLARRESNNLKAARDHYPATQSNLDHLAKVTKTYAVIADSLAALALVAATVTIYSTVTAPADDTGAQAGTRVSLGFGTLQLQTTF